MTKGVHVTLEGDANDYVGKVCSLIIVTSIILIYTFFRVFLEVK